MNNIRGELNNMGIVCDRISLLQDKDGITVARVTSGENNYVVKYFRKEEYKREIKNYHLLSSMCVPTIRVIDTTENALLLEDIDRSPVYRLAVLEDMSDSETARCLAVWYKQLHSKGYDYVGTYRRAMYDESDLFTLENIAYIKEKTGTQDVAAWTWLEQHFALIDGLLRKVRRTLTYNDFYYTNMVVAKDKTSALMFDYNLLGKGYAYADLRNVVSSLSVDAGKAFLEEYGEFDPAEKVLDDVVSVITTLYMACHREKFPWWAQELLDGIETTFIEKIDNLRQIQRNCVWF